MQWAVLHLAIGELILNNSGEALVKRMIEIVNWCKLNTHTALMCSSSVRQSKWPLFISTVLLEWLYNGWYIFFKGGGILHSGIIKAEYWFLDLF